MLDDYRAMGSITDEFKHKNCVWTCKYECQLAEVFRVFAFDGITWVTSSMLL